jgi:PAS domain S-box-containing protein
MNGVLPEAGSNDEISASIEILHDASERLEELTAGEVDTVANRQGQTFLLRPAQVSLRDSDAAKQAAILGALPVNIALLDSQGAIVSVNEAWQRFADANALLGPRYGIGVNYPAVCDQAKDGDLVDARLAAAGIRLVLSGATPGFSMEYACHSPSVRRWFMLKVAQLAQDYPQGAVIMHLDVTGEREAEERVRVSEARFWQLAENIHDVFLLRNVDGSEVYHLSPEYERIWDRTCASVYADPTAWGQSMHPEDVEDASRKFHEGRYSGVDCEYRIIRPDGGQRWIWVRTFPILDDSGIPYRTAGIAASITARKESSSGSGGSIVSTRY